MNSKKELQVVENKIRRALQYIGDDVYISTKTIQDIFGVKKHSTVIERVRKELDLDAFGVQQDGHQTKESHMVIRGKNEKTYLLNSEEFMQVGMSIRTPLAKLYRKVISKLLHGAIRTLMKNKLTVELNVNNPDWLPYRLGGKEVRLTLTDAIAKVVLIERVKEGKEGDGWAFKLYTNLIYKSLNIEAPAKGVPIRDILTPTQLEDVKKLEAEVAEMILSSTEHYKATYQTIKKKLEA